MKTTMDKSPTKKDSNLDNTSVNYQLSQSSDSFDGDPKLAETTKKNGPGKK